MRVEKAVEVLGEAIDEELDGSSMKEPCLDLLRVMRDLIALAADKAPPSDDERAGQPGTGRVEGPMEFELRTDRVYGNGPQVIAVSYDPEGGFAHFADVTRRVAGTRTVGFGLAQWQVEHLVMKSYDECTYSSTTQADKLLREELEKRGLK